MPNDRIALITGANKGLGFATARLLGEQRAVILLAARDEARGNRAAAELTARGLKVVPVHLDVTAGPTIASVADFIGQRYGHLDILVNNAGIAGPATARPSEVTVRQLREVYQANVFGVVAVTNAMLPWLRRSTAGRIVNVSSHVGSLALGLDPESELRNLNLMAYQSSKTALNAVTVAYAKELAGTGIKVNAACPGPTSTDLNPRRGGHPAEVGARITVRLATIGSDGPTGTCQDDNGIVPW